ncbi:MAG: TetR/AcrR family transcriptional regulator [Microbacterium sp.]|nr:MAG: TetR/AcrR family transcriptional regulator [Microbacterium sp.]
MRARYCAPVLRARGLTTVGEREARRYAGTVTATWRETQKANRRAHLLERAAALFAERGFAAVTTVELGEAVGMSGPALYRHFANKEAILAELLVDASERLLEGCRTILAGDAASAVDRLDELIRFHIGFAVEAPDIIRIQDRELAGLPAATSHRVRELQRTYVAEWDAVLAAARPELAAEERRVRLLGTFGLLNSTPHSARGAGAEAERVLARMAHHALLG